MGLSDSRRGHTTLCIPRHVEAQLLLTPTGLPGSSADLSLRAVPFHPGESGECNLVFFPTDTNQASSYLADWPLPLL